MTNENTQCAAIAAATGPARQIRCLACSEPITGDGYTVPAVHPYATPDGEVHVWRAAYHPACLPALWAAKLAIANASA